MEYDFTGLGPFRFEELCQALAFDAFDDVRVFGAGPDGGRDATFREPGTGRLGVLQVKHRQRPLDTLAASRWLCEQVHRELKRWASPGRRPELGVRRPTVLVIATNVALSAVLNRGGVDRVETLLRERAPAVGFEKWHVWDEAQLTAMLHRNAAVRAAFGLDDRGGRGCAWPRAGAPVGQLVAGLTDPFQFEVHRPIDVCLRHNAANAPSLKVLPTYVSRRHDLALNALIQRAAAGTSVIAALVGGSSTGKTRAGWEAIHALPHGWRLWHPIDPNCPEATVNGLANVMPRTVVWLNEAQLYLITPGSQLGERVAAGLRELLRSPEHAPVLVLATLWPTYWARLSMVPAAGETDLHPQARALLANADVAVPDRFDSNALLATKAASRDDPRLAMALNRAEDGRIAQFLAGVPLLLARYRTAPAAAQALVHAAVDARLLGAPVDVTRPLLATGAPGYLSEAEWDALDADWLESALSYLGSPCHGIRGPLAVTRPRSGNSASGAPVVYRLADYLYQTVAGKRRTVPPPAELWEALLVNADPTSLLSFGRAAEDRQLYRLAFRFYVAAADADKNSPYALTRATHLLTSHGRCGEAVAWLRERADHGDPLAPSKADAIETWVQATVERIEQLRQQAESGDNVAVLEEAAKLLVALDRIDEAFEWLRGHALTGNLSAVHVSILVLWSLGRRADIERIVESFPTDIPGARRLPDPPIPPIPPDPPIPNDSSLHDAFQLYLHNLRARLKQGEPIVDLADAIVLAREYGPSALAVDVCLRAVEVGVRCTTSKEFGVNGALLEAVALLRGSGRVEEADRLLRYGIEPGGAIAEPWPAAHPRRNDRGQDSTRPAAAS